MLRNEPVKERFRAKVEMIRVRLAYSLAGALALCSCNRPAEDSAQSNEVPSSVANTPAPTQLERAEVNAPSKVDKPSARASLPEPHGPIDPKSIEAAGQVVQEYGALIEQGRWTASREYWSNADAAKAFERNFRTYSDVHVEIGDLGPAEGAAGSIYVTEPLTFYGKTNGGGDYRRAAKVMLRRVNDVPGSTAEQRQWHIERIDWAN